MVQPLQQVRENWLKNKKPEEYRQLLYNEMLFSMQRYKTRRLQNSGAPEEEVKQSQKQEQSLKQKPIHCEFTDVVKPEMPKMDKKLEYVKFGSCCSRSPISRFGILNPVTQQYEYFRAFNDTTPVKDKSLSLTSCSCSIEQKNAKSEQWTDGTNKTHRLCMKFDQRQSRPIYYYSNDIHELHVMRAYVKFCKLQKDFGGEKLKAILSTMLAVLHFNLVSVPYNIMIKLYEEINARTIRQNAMFYNFTTAMKKAIADHDITIIEWRNFHLRKINAIKEKMKGGMRAMQYMKTVRHDADYYSDALVLAECSRIIKDKYRRHREEEVKEYGRRKKNDLDQLEKFSVFAKYDIFPEIQSYCKGMKEIKDEHKVFASFNIPEDSFIEKTGICMLDNKNNQMIVAAVDREEYPSGTYPFGEISCLVIGEAPGGIGSNKAPLKWIRVNGRKFKKAESFLNELKAEERKQKIPKVYNIDPSSVFQAQCAESFLGTKSLLELKLYSVTINKYDEIVKRMESDNIAFSVMIKIGDNFYTRTTFIRAKPAKRGYSCEFRKNYRLKVDMDYVDHISISLWVRKIETNDLPDQMISLQNAKRIGYTNYSKDYFPKTEAKKAQWIPLNNSFYMENIVLNEGDSMVALNIQLLENIPGNAPEVALNGINYYIGEIVYYLERVELRYPDRKADFLKLDRKDIAYDQEMAGKVGCPLRLPGNLDEWKASGLPGEFDPNSIQKAHYLDMQAKVPFIFVLPETEEEFKQKNLPGVYNELINIQGIKPGETVMTMHHLIAKRMCKLISMNTEGECILVPLDMIPEGDKSVLPGQKNVVKKKKDEIMSVTEEGISAFEYPDYVPLEITNNKTDYDWKLYLGFKDEVQELEFLRKLKQAIRNFWFDEAIKTRGGLALGKADIRPPITGELRISVTEAKNLYLTEKNVPYNPYVKLGFKTTKSIVNLFTSYALEDTFLDRLETTLKNQHRSSAKSGQNPNWRTPESPEGESISMGTISQIQKQNILIDISVCTEYKEGEETKEYEIGHAELPLNKVINIKEPAAYYWLLLKGEFFQKLPQIKIWTIFIPTEKTMEDYKISPLISPNPIHCFAGQLLKQANEENDIQDQYHQRISLGEYNPNYMRVEQDFVESLKQKAKAEEENIINATLLKAINPDRAVYEPWEYKLMNAYKYLRSKIKSVIFENMSGYMWDNFLMQLLMNVTKMRTMTMEGPEAAKFAEDQMNKGLKKIRGTLMSLDRLLIWREAKSWKYYELVGLCKLGIPKELRPKIWAELFGIIKGEDQSEFDARRGEYRYYVERSLCQDAIIFLQMEKDILNINLTHLSAESDKIKLHNERAGILKIAKAYYMWCMDQNSNIERGKSDLEEKKKADSKAAQNSFKGYFKGIMHLIQKIWQVFEEHEAFWCLIGFSKVLPYIFEVQPVMTGKVAWGQKMIMLVINTIMDIKYKALYKAILAHGLPLEYYLSDKISNLLSTVFPTETLLRFFDIIALEAASQDPKRAMWILVSGCILLLLLNEPYLLAARSPEEIEIVINNTGINNLDTMKIVNRVHDLGLELFGAYHPTIDALLYVITGNANSAVAAEYMWTQKAKELDTIFKPVKEMNEKVLSFMDSLEKRGKEEEKMPKRKKQVTAVWISNFVQRFCKYYSGNAEKMKPESVYIYVSCCPNMQPSKEFSLDISYGKSKKTLHGQEPSKEIIEPPAKHEEKEEEKKLEKAPQNAGFPIQYVNQIASFPVIESDNIITFAVRSGGNDIYLAEIDIREFETDTPVTTDRPIFLKVSSSVTMQPQQFISFVILITTKAKGRVEDLFKCICKSMRVESQILPSTVMKAKDMLTSVAVTKGKMEVMMNNAGLDNTKSIYAMTPSGVLQDDLMSPGSRGEGKTIGNEPSEGDKENDKLALRQIIALIMSPEQVDYGEYEAGDNPELLGLANTAYDLFAKYYKGKVPLKRLLISLIACSHLTLEEKLEHFFDLYAAGTKSIYSFTLEELTELVQLLYELHLCSLPLEMIPRAVEQVMLPQGCTRITGAYIIASGTDLQVLLQQILTGNLDRQYIIKVTEKVKANIEKYWELWGRKNIAMTDTASLFSTLEKAVDKIKVRPGKKGQYGLLITYRHRGGVFYKIYHYDNSGKLIRPPYPVDPNADPKENALMELLAVCSQSLTFTGERIPLHKNEFVTRFKQLPLLPDLMRMHLSQINRFAEKQVINLQVDIVHEGQLKAQIMFDANTAPLRDKTETAGGDVRPTPKESMVVESGIGISGGLAKSLIDYNKRNEIYSLILPRIYEEDLLVEVKGRILTAIEELTLKLTQQQVEYDASIYFMNTLEFMVPDVGPLDDYMRITKLDQSLKKIVLNVRNASEEFKAEIRRTKRIYSLHVQCDNSWEWLKCVDIKLVNKIFMVKLDMFPKVQMAKKRNIVLLQSKEYREEDNRPMEAMGTALMELWKKEKQNTKEEMIK